MDKEIHYRSLENMYKTAPVNDFYKPTLTVKEGESVLKMNIEKKHHHAAGAIHGSVYFKLLDDAAYFAANSLEFEVFVVTTSFTTYLTRPVSEGTLTAIGNVVNQNNSQFIAEAVIYNSEGKEIGRGNGIFIRSKTTLSPDIGYKA